MSGTEVLLIRHAAHDLLGKVYCGRMPGIVLGEAGLAEARDLATVLADVPMAAVICGPLERVRQTAEPIAAAQGLAVEIDGAFDEIDLGQWSGKAFAALEGDPAWARWNDARDIARPPDGESMVEARDRIFAGIERLARRFPGTKVVVVTHADMVKAAVARVLDLRLDRLDRFDIPPASVSRIVVGDWGAKLVSLAEMPGRTIRASAMRAAC